MQNKRKINKIFLSLCEKNDSLGYLGWDHVDGLNSRIFTRSPFYRNRLMRLAWMQFFKHSPINFRKYTEVPKSLNPKGLALILLSYTNYYRYSGDKEFLKKIYKLINLIKKMRTINRPYYCWGYNFFWESLAFSVRPFTPNIIVSSFMADALLNLYEIDKNSSWLTIATDVSKFIIEELVLFENHKELCFGYIPGETPRVHNANLIAARLFARLSQYTNNPLLKEMSKKSIDYSINRQNNDGSWFYGEMKHWKWIDNFHTGYNLVAINDYMKYSGDRIYSRALEKGMAYHLRYHYNKKLYPKYYNGKLYPMDIHNFAQSIITFTNFGNNLFAKNISNLCIREMYDYNDNYFYYQKTKLYINKINYFRWSQAWMSYALSYYLLNSKK